MRASTDRHRSALPSGVSEDALKLSLVARPIHISACVEQPGVRLEALLAVSDSTQAIPISGHYATAACRSSRARTALSWYPFAPARSSALSAMATPSAVSPLASRHCAQAHRFRASHAFTP